MTGVADRQCIFFRVDSSFRIGSGHLRRCLTLARALREQDAEISFVCRNQSGSLHSEIVEAGFALHLLSEPPPTDTDGYAAWLGVNEDEDVRETLSVIGESGCDTLVVDHYALGAEWHGVARRLARRIVVIDDLVSRELDCDVVINTAPGSPGRYDMLVRDGAQKLLGPQYAFIGPSFTSRMKSLPDRSRTISAILITFGGFDNDNMAGAAIDGVRAALGVSVTIHVVLASQAPHLAMLRARAADDPQLYLHVDTKEMAGLMADSDLAIGAAGTTSWERACLGLPSLISVAAENQRATAIALAESGCAMVLPEDGLLRDTIRQAVATLSDNPGVRRLMSAAAMRTVDGRGIRRITDNLAPRRLHLRRATEMDSENLWRWRNAEHVRAMSISSDPIDKDNHDIWFATRLADKNCIFLIGRRQEIDIGMVRYDIENGIARISIHLADNAPTGAGLGSFLLNEADAWLAANRLDVTAVHADVLPQNSASLALFRSASYEPFQHQFRRTIFR